MSPKFDPVGVSRTLWYPDLRRPDRWSQRCPGDPCGVVFLAPSAPCGLRSQGSGQKVDPVGVSRPPKVAWDQPSAVTGLVAPQARNETCGGALPSVRRADEVKW